MPLKEFVLKHVFENISSLKEGDCQHSEVEEHFGVPWQISINREEEHLGVYLNCPIESDEDKKWSIETRFDMSINSVNGNSNIETYGYTFENNKKTTYRSRYYIGWNYLMMNYVIDDQVIVEIHMKIEKMTGIKKKLRRFDESAKEYSDVVLVVENEKFYVSKLFIAHQSSYFTSLLLENIEESKKAEITLTGIEAKNFQNYLETLYGEPAIDDDTVNGILHLADKYETKTIIRQCEEFLIEKSGKSAKAKLELAIKHNFTELKTKCVMGIEKIGEIQSILDGDMSQLDHSVLVSLLRKSVSVRNKY